MAEICSIDFPTSISYSTSNTSEVYLQPLRLCSGELVSNTRTQDQRDSMFAMKPEMEIWPCAGGFRFFGESTYLSMDSDKIGVISSETAEIWRVKLGPSAQTGIA